MNLDKLNQRFAGSLMPGGTLGASFTILDPSQVAILDNIVAGGDIEVVARVVVYGDVEGGYVESKPFEYPITLCSGCLAIDVGSCATAQEPDAANGQLCFPGQNVGVECCDGICPAIPTM
jgi:hypothetical protein